MWRLTRNFDTIWQGLAMGVIVSKENRNRTKKVQQTAAVVSALKMASKDNKGKVSPTVSNHSKDSLSVETQTQNNSNELQNARFSTRDDDLDREHMASMNHDKTSLSYGLPNLGNADSYVSGTTGYWDKNDKSAVTVPYFGAWKNRVSGKSYELIHCLSQGCQLPTSSNIDGW